MAALVAGTAVGADEKASGATLLVGPPIESIGALEFGADGVLFAGDSRAAAVYALHVGQAETSATEFQRVDGVDSKIAAMLGVDVRDIFVKDMAVGSGAVYLSVMRGGGADAAPALIKISPDGEFHHVAFDGLSYTKLDLADAPASDPGSRRDPRGLAVTDMELIGDQLYIAGLSNEEFASSLRRASYPFGAGTSTTGLEIYHGAHGQFETHAPIYTFMPIELSGKPHVLAGYLCTPLVAFSVEQLESGSEIRGKTIAELGFGNIPIDMLSFEQEGAQFVLLTNSRRGTMKIALADLEGAYGRAGITEPVGDVTAGVDYVPLPMGNVLQVDNYGNGNVLILDRNAENGSLSLSLRPHNRL